MGSQLCCYGAMERPRWPAGLLSQRGHCDTLNLVSRISLASICSLKKTTSSKGESRGASRYQNRNVGYHLRKYDLEQGQAAKQERGLPSKAEEPFLCTRPGKWWASRDADPPNTCSSHWVNDWPSTNICSQSEQLPEKRSIHLPNSDSEDLPIWDPNRSEGGGVESKLKDRGGCRGLRLTVHWVRVGVLIWKVGLPIWQVEI